MKKSKLCWLFSVILLSLIFGVIYKVCRVSLDSTLHDPLTYEAVSTAWRLSDVQQANGQLKVDLPIKVNVANNLSTFITVYDHEKNVIASSGELDGETPALEPQFLENTNQYVRNYFDWRPSQDVHLAGTTVAVGDDGYVLVGRNMQEADRQGNRVTKAVVIGWIASVIILTVGFSLVNRKRG